MSLFAPSLSKTFDEAELIDFLKEGGDIKAEYYDFAGRSDGGRAFRFHENTESQIILLIKYGFDIHSQDEEGNTLLHICKSCKIVDFLISQGANIEKKNNEEASPLMTQACINHEDIAMRLIILGADINTIMSGGYKLIDFPISLDFKIYLIKNGIDLRDRDGIHILFKENNLEIAKALIDREGLDNLFIEIENNKNYKENEMIAFIQSCIEKHHLSKNVYNIERMPNKRL